ncbi:MAG: excinuclease ABC subunit UvrC, partial [Epsilonproteobacteria bacterium]|nr:excinuclease ABC subunit UvrC [Campylobacterota bacterium]
PDSPGVYQYFDKEGKLLYIGKAKSLKNRVKSYFSFTPTLMPSPRLSLRIRKMISEASSLEYIVVSNEHDALVLENSLIKQLKPKYNILLRDDKTYPYIYIDLNDDFPRFEITRNIKNGKNIKYFGPFTTASRDILNSLYELYPLVQKKGSLKGKKACLFYQIGKCKAPCEGKIDTKEYKKIVLKALESLKNKQNLLNLLNEKMQNYAQKELFEEAARVRDAINKIKDSQILSQVDLKTKDNLDVFALYGKDTKAVLVKMFVREGKIVSLTSTLIRNDNGINKDEVYSSAIIEFYKDDKPKIAKNIVVFEEFEQQKEVENFLKEKIDRQLKITVPKRGAKKELANIAYNNAKESLTKDKSSNEEDLLKEIKRVLALSSTPNTVEAFDNSHLQGSSPVGSCIVYENGFKKDRYKRYNLTQRDEYAQMRELLIRRCESFEKNPPPDLWVIDGGETLLKLAYDITESFGVNLDIVAISKEKKQKRTIRAKGKAEDKLYNKEGKVALQSDSKVLQFIQRLRDEAHRFAINFHRSQKQKQDRQIELLNQKGIGLAKVKKLLTYFGTFEAIYQASKDELSKVLNPKDAKNIASINRQS